MTDITSLVHAAEFDTEEADGGTAVVIRLVCSNAYAAEVLMEDLAQRAGTASGLTLKLMGLRVRERKQP